MRRILHLAVALSVAGDRTRPVKALWTNDDRVFRRAEELGFLLLIARPR
jgi:hypothetical protein